MTSHAQVVHDTARKRMWVTSTMGLVAGVAGFVLALAPVAHADDTSYLANLAARGVPTSEPLEHTWVKNGHRVCDALRAGQTPESLQGRFGAANAFGPAAVAAAEQELCPGV